MKSKSEAKRIDKEERNKLRNENEKTKWPGKKRFAAHFSVGPNFAVKDIPFFLQKKQKWRKKYRLLESTVMKCETTSSHLAFSKVTRPDLLAKSEMGGRKNNLIDECQN